MTGRIRLLAAPRTRIEWQAVGVFEHHTNFFRRQAERFTDHLLAHGVITGPDVRYTGENIDLAVGLKDKRRARLSLWRSAVIERHPPTVIFLDAALSPPGGLNGSLQHFSHEDVAPFFSHRIGVAVLQNISPPQLERVNAHLLRDNVHMRLESEYDLGAARRPRLGAGHLVGVGAESLHFDGRTAVHARQAPSTGNRHLRIGLLRSISAAAEINCRLYSSKGSVLFHPGA